MNTALSADAKRAVARQNARVRRGRCACGCRTSLEGRRAGARTAGAECRKRAERERIAAEFPGDGPDGFWRGVARVRRGATFGRSKRRTRPGQGQAPVPAPQPATAVHSAAGTHHQDAA